MRSQELTGCKQRGKHNGWMDLFYPLVIDGIQMSGKEKFILKKCILLLRDGPTQSVWFMETIITFYTLHEMHFMVENCWIRWNKYIFVKRFQKCLLNRVYKKNTLCKHG